MSLACIVALSGCASEPPEVAVKMIVPSYFTRPAKYSHLEALSAGYFSGKDGNPWISFIDTNGNVIVSRFDGEWHEIRIDLADIPQDHQGIGVLAAGYVPVIDPITNDKSPWVTFKDSTGGTFTYHLSHAAFKERIITD